MAERRRLQRNSQNTHDSIFPNRSPPSRPSTSLRMSNPNIFSDEFSLEPLNSPPSRSSSTYSRSANNHTTPSSPPRDRFSRTNSDRSTQLGPSDSISQYGNQDEPASRVSMASQSEDSPFSDPIPQRNVSVRTNASGISHGPQRSISSASSWVPPRPEGPYRGPTGPSQPYSMYPQGVTRTSTISSASTVRRPEGAYVPGRGPQHPYSLYPQNTVPEIDEGSGLNLAQIPVGFPGHATQPYERQIGPDGEDVADIIGPDGHAEPLPPYTRYPDGVPPKGGIPGPASILSEERAMEEAQTDEAVPSQEHVLSAANVVPTASSSDNSTSDASGSFKEKVVRKGRRRVCCGYLPCWALLVLISLFILGVILGGVVGGITANHKAKEENEAEVQANETESVRVSTVTQTALPTSDASPLPSPYKWGSGGPPSGSFTIPLGDPQISSSTCVDGIASVAWDCETAGDLIISVEPTEKGVEAVFTPDPNWTNGSVIYGPQPPVLDSTPYSLSMMMDTDSPSYGPALYFWDYFDKLVIVEEDAFEQYTSRSRRDGIDASDIFERGMGEYNRRAADIGEKPWFCYWNQTVIEMFIYVKQMSSAYSSAAAVSSALYTSYPTTASDYDLDAEETSAATPMYQHQHDPEFMPPFALPGQSSKGHRAHPRDVDWDGTGFPRVVKIEEKRKDENKIQPYCQQFQILNDGSYGPVTDTDGNLVIRNFQEKNAGGAKKRTAGKRWVGDIGKRDDDSSSNNCCCEWMSS